MHGWRCVLQVLKRIGRRNVTEAIKVEKVENESANAMSGESANSGE